uniref:Tubulin/FtsZ GTPase domain-containing protein n=1 Tax=Anopheles farauti TaxID=69004 RepID=A0A182Q3B5_9DIPT
MREIVHLQAGQCGNQIGAKRMPRSYGSVPFQSSQVASRALFDAAAPECFGGEVSEALKRTQYAPMHGASEVRCAGRVRSLADRFVSVTGGSRDRARNLIRSTSSDRGPIGSSISSLNRRREETPSMGLLRRKF